MFLYDKYLTFLILNTFLNPFCNHHSYSWPYQDLCRTKVAHWTIAESRNSDFDESKHAIFVLNLRLYEIPVGKYYFIFAINTTIVIVFQKLYKHHNNAECILLGTRNTLNIILALYGIWIVMNIVFLTNRETITFLRLEFHYIAKWDANSELKYISFTPKPNHFFMS